jgi:hypothetical protein
MQMPHACGAPMPQVADAERSANVFRQVDPTFLGSIRSFRACSRDNAGKST